MPGFPVLHYLPEIAQTHVHGVNDVSVTPFSSLLPPSHPCRPLLLLPQSFPASGSFPMSRLFGSLRDQSIGASALASVLRKNIQGWFPLGWLVWSPCSPRDSQESSPAPQFKASIFKPICEASPSNWPTCRLSQCQNHVSSSSGQKSLGQNPYQSMENSADSLFEMYETHSESNCVDYLQTVTTVISLLDYSLWPP